MEVAGAGGGDVRQDAARLVRYPRRRGVVRAAQRHQPVYPAQALLQQGQTSLFRCLSTTSDERWREGMLL